MSFQTPLALVALVVLPLLVVWYVRRERRRRADAAAFGNPELMPNLVDASPGRLRHVPLAIFLVALAAMIVGVARPHATVSVPKEEATVLLGIDTSISMKATDVKPTRLEAARAAARAFLAKVPEKFRVGIIAFNGRPLVVLPPTQDRALARAALANLRPGEGTALGDAVGLGLQVTRRLRASDGSVPPATMLLISDGAQMSGRTTPLAAAQAARKAHVPLNTVLLGTPNGVIHVKLTGGFTEDIRVPPNPATLQLVSRVSGGQFFAVADDTQLRDVYERLGSRLGRSKESREISDVFAGGSAALLLVGGALSALWFRRVP